MKSRCLKIVRSIIFHVSRLKKVLRKHISPCSDLPPLENEGKLILEPETILERRDRRLRNRTIPEYLVKWKNLPKEDATWVGEEALSHTTLLGDKKNQEGGTVMNLD